MSTRALATTETVERRRAKGAVAGRTTAGPAPAPAPAPAPVVALCFPFPTETDASGVLFSRREVSFLAAARENGSSSSPGQSSESTLISSPRPPSDPPSLYGTPSSIDRRGRNENEKGASPSGSSAVAAADAAAACEESPPLPSSQLAAERQPGLFDGARARYLRFSSASSRRARPSYPRVALRGRSRCTTRYSHRSASSQAR